MITVRSPFLPLDEADLADNQDNNKDEDHLCVHLRMPGMLLVHSQVLVVPFLFWGQFVPFYRVPVYGDVLVLMPMPMPQPPHLYSDLKSTWSIGQWSSHKSVIHV